MAIKNRPVELSLDQQIQRAERARQILNDEVFSEAVERIEEALLSGLRRSAFTDDKLREKLGQRYALLHDLLDQLNSTMQTGELARAQLEFDEKQSAFQKLRQVVGL